MIDVLIVEDEMPSARKLKAMLDVQAPDFNVVSILDSVQSTLAFLKDHTVELIFLDIHLADGNSFQLFEHNTIQTPIIFTTAYDQYAIQAFDYNSIGYLLKPFGADKLKSVIDKYRNNHQQQANTFIDYQLIGKMIAQQQHPEYRERFLVHYRDKLKAIAISEVAYLYAENRGVFICTHEGRIFDISQTLEQLMNELDPKLFYRVNRKFIVNVVAITEVHLYSKSKLKLALKPSAPCDVIISSEKAARFKQWLAR